MDRLLLLLLLFLLSFLTLSSSVRAMTCPKRCSCQNLSPSFTILCTKTGLLFVPAGIDRRTAELRLMDNFITTLRRQDFANLTSLIHLTLSRNTISQILPHAFADLRGLHALHLDSNRLTSVAQDHFRGLVNLRHLILSNNQLSYISPSSLEDFLETIEDLDLSYNNLAQLPWQTIARLSNVNTLSLDHNLIEFVPEGIFSNLHKLARLDMTSNKLKKIPPDPLFSRIPVYAKSKGSPLSSLVLSFGGNPLHCNCELVWLRRLTREDDLETCASPPELMGKYFWSIKEEEFVCEPPMITHRTPKLAATEGQSTSLKCKAVGDPEPYVRWISPEGKLVSNTSRTTSYHNGTLDIRVASLADQGTFTCIASNAAGESTAAVELQVSPHPNLGNSSNCEQEPGPGASDILTSAKATAQNESQERAGGAGGTGGAVAAVAVAELTSSSALIRWPAQHHLPDLRMYQLQYNSSSDDSLVYRMLPASSLSFSLTDLAASREYDLCVLAVYHDPSSSLTATRALGCVTFTTRPEPGKRCPALHAHFLGGTMIIIIGGIIVASVLVFIFILLMKYKVYNNQHPPPAPLPPPHHHHKDKGTKATTTTCSQTNGSQSCPPAPSAPPPHLGLAERRGSWHQDWYGKGKTVVEMDEGKVTPTTHAGLGAAEALP